MQVGKGCKNGYGNFSEGCFLQGPLYVLYMIMTYTYEKTV